MKAEHFFTTEQDGLKQMWYGRIFMNPPYQGDLISQFVQKLCESPKVTEFVILVNNATETRWFQVLLGMSTAVCFPKGRVKFWHPRKIAVPLQGQAVLYFGNDLKAFRQEFNHFGAICHVQRPL